MVNLFFSPSIFFSETTADKYRTCLINDVETAIRNTNCKRNHAILFKTMKLWLIQISYFKKGRRHVGKILTLKIL